MFSYIAATAGVPDGLMRTYMREVSPDHGHSHAHGSEFRVDFTREQWGSNEPHWALAELTDCGAPAVVKKARCLLSARAHSRTRLVR
mgnify:CR=1 FL=1